MHIKRPIKQRSGILKLTHPKAHATIIYSKFLLKLYPSRYSLIFFIEKTNEFDKWLKKLKDFKAKAKILFRIQKLETDEHFGDCKTVGEGIRELRINFAKGYRVYFKEKDGVIIVLLIDGDKSTQEKDIAKAKEIWKKLNN